MESKESKEISDFYRYLILVVPFDLPFWGTINRLIIKAYGEKYLIRIKKTAWKRRSK